jgi:thioredoxin family protein
VARMSFVAGFLCAALSVLTAATPVDYAALFAKGVSYHDFLDAARSRRDEWLERSKDATVAADAVARVKQLGARRRLLVVAEDWCGDSANTLPYLARLAEAAPDVLDLRIVDSSIGRPVMEEHKTPDGRAATPTVVVLDESGALIAAWVERPSGLQKWYIGQQDVLGRTELLDQKYKWYREDQGRSAIREVVELLTLNANK